MFYLNRGGAPEGPYEEGRIVQMIHSGELSHAGVCPVGQNQWWPLQQFPTFAQALAQRSAAAPPAYAGPPAAYGAAPGAAGYAPNQATPPGYGPAPGASGYGPAPAAPGYGPGPTVPGYGPTPGPGPTLPGYAPDAGRPSTGAQAARPSVAGRSKSGGRTLLIVGLGLVLLLFVVGSAIGAYLLFFAGGGAPKMAESMPRDCELMLAVESLPQLLADVKKVEYLDTSLRDDKKLFDDTADSVAKAFDISLGDARSLLVASRSFGFGARKLSGATEAGFAIGFSGAGAVEELLKSPRFIASGALGQTGKRYQLTKKVLQSSTGQDIVLKGLAEAELGTGKEVLVWFPQHKLLTFGTEAFVADLARVLEEGAPPIQTNPSYQAAAKDFGAEARSTLFLDPTLISSVDDVKLRELVDGYFKPAGPVSGMLGIAPAGFVTTLTGRVIGSKLPRGSTYQAPGKLEIAQRLPAETFAYLAFQTETKLSGAEVRKLLLDQLQATDPAARRDVESGLAQLEQMLGVSFSRLMDGLGSQAVVGLAAPPDFNLDLAALAAGPQAAARLNLTWAQQLDDESEYKRLAAELKQKLLPKIREVNLTEDGPGFALTPRGAPMPVSLRVKFFDKHLFVTAGDNVLCDRAEAAFGKGDRTLKDDAAHQAALAALPQTHHLRLWLDTGRIGDTLFKNPLLRARAVEEGINLEKFRLTGPQRVTSALSLRGEVQNEVWTYRFDGLNLQAIAPLGLGAVALGGTRAPALLPPL